MRFLPTEEQQALREATRAFLAQLPGPLAMAEPGARYDRNLWVRVVEEQGWPAILVPERHGGWGFGLVEAALVFEEAGRRLVPVPLLGTVGLGVMAILTLGDEAAQAEHLPALLAGATATASLAPSVVAVQDGGHWVLEGRAERVIDAIDADFVVVCTPAGAFVVPGEHTHRTALPVLDPGRPLADVQLEGLRLPESARLGGANVHAVALRAAVLLAAEQVGGAEAVLDLTVEYAKVRQQFGRAIGSFQAIQHACADMLVQIEAARSATWYAAAALQAQAPDAELAARTAKALASDAFFRCAGAAIQCHGGIGFTWEHACHAYFKRARAGLSLLGEPREHRARIADALIAGEAPWT